MSKEQDNHPKIHSTRIGDHKIRCGAKDFRYGVKSSRKSWGDKSRCGASHPSASPCSTHSYIRAKRPLQITWSSIMDIMIVKTSPKIPNCRYYPYSNPWIISPQRRLFLSISNLFRNR